ncbi:hypothetical protein [Brevibacillus sp. SYSU BS000544]|uniref:hypothetical protein n=1 Tax=Brevibacillus sp. SYSU BS000544 TaxID=3416443 RepID=UPI003CE567C8
MINNTIFNRVNNAISKLFERDQYLLVNNLNERTIAHKFAVYLQEEFFDLNVDCEYNKNVDEDDGSKNIYVVKVEAERLRKSINKEIVIDEIIHSVISIYPDIVIHNRGENNSNLLIIEIKKSTNLIDRYYDFKKLQCYTDNTPHNKLKYQYGLFIEFETNVPKPRKPELIWFKDGEIVSQE